MKKSIHLLDCAPLHPYLPRWDVGTTCVLLESSDGLVLVDTGFGVGDYRNPPPKVRWFTAFIGSRRDVEDTALHQVQKLGYRPGDVRHIVMTHLHLDHAGGLPDFPHAQVHVLRAEYEAALAPASFLERFYVAQHFAHQPHWVIHDPQGEQWHAFQSVRILPAVSPEIHLVPLPGHTRGHCGVAVQVAEGHWLFHCGDALPAGFPETDPPEWLSRPMIGAHTSRLRQFASQHQDEILLISAHFLKGQLETNRAALESL